ncbi:hypothetical protein SAMN05518801_11450 [Novosphingobium sp. CF614]|uniref:hypothetical protein n=1 Tax=Novosphingobium sp. CF614 TaxID=1884364 RepID=UPI0008E8510E|nr:hypothetical protein [Novosphingobium sp. CF614]SFG29443.1 hypothetical protein SAMN05518801_11450 [Novosphingobium sp. CF614]
MAQTKIAFALAGLGGFNAHGAGFLQAARDNDVVPDLVTATSGQIVVLEAYLREVPDLKAGLIDPSIEGNPLAQLQIALFGYDGVFEPALSDAVARLLKPPYLGLGFDFFADRFLPAQIYRPSRTAATIKRIKDTFNGHEIGVVFNAYDPSTGRGKLYGNNAARQRMKQKSSVPVLEDQRSADPRAGKQGADEEVIHKIDEQAIEAALWLSLYGFAGMPGGLIDGAYHRSCILSELHNFEDVFVCRPLANGWCKDQLPQNYFDVQDWNTEMWFSASYKAEADAMKRINRLVNRGAFKPEAGMTEVRLWEVEPDTPAGYFNYFIERNSVFDEARRKGTEKFRQAAERRAHPATAATN